MGWRGINIDATPGAMRLFCDIRSGDINVEAFVAEEKGSVTMYLFNEPALNTCSAKQVAKVLSSSSRYQVVGEVSVATRTLHSILDEHLTESQTIDLLHIDVEGAEMGVLRSNDWNRYRPNLVLVEQLATDLSKTFDHETTRFLHKVGYLPIMRTYSTVFFCKREEIKGSIRAP